MNLFGRKSAGRAPVRPALARGFPWAFNDIPRSYEAQVRAGYLENAVGQRAVRMVAEAVGGAPLSASDPGLAALVSATSAGQSLLETLAAQLLLHGNGFIQILEGADGRPRELYALRPERVSVEGDARGWPVAFGYRANQVNTRLPADMVIHAKAMHPLDDHYGLGCLGAASGAIAIHNAATLWNKALLDNAARPSGALVYDAGEALSPEQFEQLRTELEASFSGAGNAGRPMLLEGGLKWQALSLTPAEMDFAGLKAAAAREIALAFGVPPVLLGLPGDATYANYREANRALWRQTVLPLAGKLLGAIAQGLARWYPRATLAVDLDRVTELSEDRERLWAQVNAAGFLTLNEKRAAVGLEALGAATLDVMAGGDPAPDSTASVAADATVPPEMKYNHNHDPDNGQFTFATGGAGFSGGGGNLSLLASAASSVTIPLDRPTPMNNEPTTGTRRLPNGGIEVPLDPPSTPVSDRAYRTAPGIHAPSQIEPTVNSIAKDFTDQTGKTLTLNSGYRTSARQAEAMFVKFARGNTGSEYANKIAAAEIRQAFLDGMEAKTPRRQIVATMAEVIDNQVKEGTYISLHMTGRAVDIKTVGKNYSDKEKALLFQLATSHGGKAIKEGVPPHIHIQFPASPSAKPGS